MTGVIRIELLGGPRDGELYSVNVVDGVLPTSVYVATPADSATARYARDPREPVTGLTPRYRYTPGA